MVSHNLARPVALAVVMVAYSTLVSCVTTTTTTPSVGSRTTTVSTSTSKKQKPPDPSPANAVSTDATNALVAQATRQVIAAEEAFAKTMADRDFKGFVTFLSQDAVFFSGSEITRGPAAVAAKWETYFAGREPPFSWTPDHVEVLASGNLALSTGPVFQNHRIVGRFNSVWRREAANTWRVVFDKGESVCGMTP